MITLEELGNAVDSAKKNTRGGLEISMDLRHCYFDLEIEEVEERIDGLRIYLKPFTKDELLALLEQYDEEK